jgi:hypothetical protein
MARPRRDRSRPALADRPQRNAMWMWGGLVAKHVVEQVSKSLEHMFDSLKPPRMDCNIRCRMLQAPGTL